MSIRKLKISNKTQYKFITENQKFVYILIKWTEGRLFIPMPPYHVASRNLDVTSSFPANVRG